jgi:hypothetical protein
VTDAVSALKHRPGKSSGSLLLVPVDIRDWTAQVPPDASGVYRTILEKLKEA